MPRDDATDEGKVQVVGKIYELAASAQKMPNPVSRVLQTCQFRDGLLERQTLREVRLSGEE